MKEIQFGIRKKILETNSSRSGTQQKRHKKGYQAQQTEKRKRVKETKTKREDVCAIRIVYVCQRDEHDHTKHLHVRQTWAEIKL